MEMTSQELMAILLPTLGNGIISGVNSSQQRGQQLQQQIQDNVQRHMLALQNAQQTSQNLQDNRQNMAQAGLNASPLGQEQGYVQRNRLMQAMLPMAAGFQPAGPSDPGIAGAIRPGTNPLTMFGDPRLQETFSDQMTGQALADRRRALAGVNPDFEFGSLGAYGMDPGLDAGVNRAQDAAGRRLSAYEGAQSSLAQQQIDLARQAQQQQQSGQQQRGGGVSGFLGGLLRTAAPFAGLIPGVGPGLALGLGAAGSALGTRLQGGSMMDSIIAGGTTAGMGALANRAQTGSWSGRTPQSPQLNNQMSAASLPLPSMPVGGQSPQLQPQTNFSIPQPYNASGDVLRQIQAPGAAPGGTRPPQPSVTTSILPPAQGMNPRSGYPMADAVPYRGGQAPAPTPPVRPSGANIGERSLLQDVITPLTNAPSEFAQGVSNRITTPTLPQTPYPWVNQANAMVNGFMGGAVEGLGNIVTGMTSPLGIATTALPAARGVGALRGMLPRTPPPTGLRIPPSVNQPIAQMQMGANANIASRNQAFNQMWQQAMSRANYTDQQNMLNIIRAAQQPGVDANAMIASPEAQAIMRRILGGQ